MSAGTARRSSTRTAILLYLTGIFFFALNDALGKWLVADYTVGQLLLLRTVGAGFILGPMLWRRGGIPRIADQRGLHLLRIVCMAADTFAFYFATKFLPLADVMTFYMASPLIVTALSGPVLGERVDLFRWGAVAVGFVGVLIALRPTDAAFSLLALIALFGATMFSFGVTITRKLHQTNWLTLVTWQFIGAGIVGTATSPVAWVTPGWLDAGLIFLVGIVAMACFICITRALALAPASVLAPFQYTAILWAMILGWLVWRDAPTPAILLGNAIIVASGTATFYRERNSDTGERKVGPAAQSSIEIG